MSVNKAIILGHLGNDPDVKVVGQNTVAVFSLATSEKWKDKDGQAKEKTEWHRVVVWDKIAENVGKCLKKGSKAYVEGKIQTRDYEDKQGVKRYTTEIIAHTVQFLDSKGTGDRPPTPSQSPSGPPAYDYNEDIV